MPVVFTDELLTLYKEAPPPKRTLLRDSEHPGFAFEITPKGKIKLQTIKTVNGRKRYISRGFWPEVSLEDARNLHLGIKPVDPETGLRSRVSRVPGPIHPLLKFDGSTHYDPVKIGDPLLSDAMSLYLYERKGAMNELGRWEGGVSGGAWKEIRRGFSWFLHECGDMRMSEMTADMLQRMIQQSINPGQKGGKGAAGLRLKKNMSAFYNWMKRRRYCRDVTGNPAADTHIEDVDVTPTNGDRFLSPDEVRLMYKHGKETLPEYAWPLVQLMLLTGQRGGEVLLMEVHEVCLERRVWTMPVGKIKTGKKVPTPHTVPLTDTAMAIIEAAIERYAPDRAAHDTDLVFCRLIGSQAANNKRREPHSPDCIGWPIRHKLHPAMGVHLKNRWSKHDLRDTTITIMAAQDVMGEIGERVVNHSQGEMVNKYNHHPYEARKREALERVEAVVNALAAMDKPAPADFFESFGKPE